MTLETVHHVREADKLLLAVPAGVAERWLMEQNASAESLRPFYGKDKDRLQTYVDMAEHVVSFVRSGLRVCLVAYGHPGVYAMPTHLAVVRARREGTTRRRCCRVYRPTRACPPTSVSTLGQGGTRSYEATDFLARRRPHDPDSQLVLWQVGLIGMLDSVSTFDPRPGLRALRDRLRESHPADHPVTLYEAATWIGETQRIDRIALADLPSARTSGKTTLYVPAVRLPDCDDDVLAALGVGPEARARRHENERCRAELLEHLRAPVLTSRGGHCAQRHRCGASSRHRIQHQSAHDRGAQIGLAFTSSATVASTPSRRRCSTRAKSTRTSRPSTGSRCQVVMEQLGTGYSRVRVSS
jgi:hypothetical protein